MVAALHRDGDHVAGMAVLGGHVRGKHLEFREGINIGLNIGATLLILCDVATVEQPTVCNIARSIDLNIYLIGTDGCASRGCSLSARGVACARNQCDELPEGTAIQWLRFDRFVLD